MQLYPEIGAGGWIIWGGHSLTSRQSLEGKHAALTTPLPPPPHYTPVILNNVLALPFYCYSC